MSKICFTIIQGRGRRKLVGIEMKQDEMILKVEYAALSSFFVCFFFVCLKLFISKRKINFQKEKRKRKTLGGRGNRAASGLGRIGTMHLSKLVSPFNPCLLCSENSRHHLHSVHLKSDQCY